MGKEIVAAEFAEAKAILRDAIFKEKADRTKKDSLGVLKLIKAREENSDFEIGLAERMCGDNPSFPYRSSYYITKFFQDLGFDFAHDGSTRRFWIKDVLLRLDTSQIATLINRGLFRRSDFRNPKLRTETTVELTEDQFISAAVVDFKRFIDESIRANEGLDLAEVLDLNLNIDLLFERQSTTKDKDLNSLIEEAKDRYLKPTDQMVAIEKLWDAFERVKTYYGENKRESASTLIEQMASDLDVDELKHEFEVLTNLGNTYRIRHHEIDKKELSNASEVKYLFFRMLALIDLALATIQRNDQTVENEP